jgi:ribosome biogenesis protein BMS1
MGKRYIYQPLSRKNSPLYWNNHPYILADRWQTVEDRNYQADDDISVSFFGYVRGGSYRVNGKLHVVGLGDYQIADIQVLNDPCPEYQKDKQENEKEKTKGDMMENDED